MATYIKLSPEDAERLGCPALLPWNMARLMAREAVALERATGLTPEALGDGITAGRVSALQALVWLALARAGVHMRLDDVDFDVAGFGFHDDDDDEAAEGKAPAETVDLPG